MTEPDPETPTVPADAGEYAPALARILARFTDPRARAVLDVGPGWYGILADLDQALAELDPAYEVVQVKQKFAGLRYYCSTTLADPERFRALIRAAEAKSFETCEECGAEGRVRTEFAGVQTLCQQHFDAELEAAAVLWREKPRTDWPEPEIAGDGWARLLEAMRWSLRGIDRSLYVQALGQDRETGALTVTWWPSREELRGQVSARIDAAVAEAAATCQRCGSGDAQLHQGADEWSTWTTVLCPPCAELVEWERDHDIAATISSTDLHYETGLDCEVREPGPVLIERPDGTLVPVLWPSRGGVPKVQVVERDGQRVWVDADAEPVPGDRRLGAPVPALILRPVS